MSGADGITRQKADPFATYAEVPPANASVVYRSRYTWSDEAWLERRRSGDPRRSPSPLYEVHAGSWRQGLSWRSSREQLVPYVADLGFTHVELMPVMRAPYPPSWGYQVSGYFAPQSTLGTPDDFRALVDAFHGAGVGVILDWVPAHFPRDEWALARFDGTSLYEHEDPRRGSHPDWGTLIFNFSRHEVRTSCSRTPSTGCASSTQTGCAWTPWPRCSTWTTRATRANGCRTSRAAARTSRPSRSCGS